MLETRSFPGINNRKATTIMNELKRIEIIHAGFSIKGKAYQVGDVVDVDESTARYAVGSKSAVYVAKKDDKYEKSLKGPSPEPKKTPVDIAAPAGSVDLEPLENAVKELEGWVDELE